MQKSKSAFLAMIGLVLGFGHGPVLAQSRDDAEARLSRTVPFSGNADTATLEFTKLDECVYRVVSVSKFGDQTTVARSDADFSAARFEKVIAEPGFDGSFGVVQISNSAGVQATRWQTESTNMSSSAIDMQRSMGAVCEGSTCVNEGRHDNLQVFVRGDDLNALMRAVSADLLTLGAACAPN